MLKFRRRVRNGFTVELLAELRKRLDVALPKNGVWPMRHGKTLSALTGAVLLSFGCGAVHSGETKPVIVSVDQDGITINLSKAEALIVRLPAQLGTGFSWAVLNAGQAPVRLVSSQIEHHDPGLPGGAEIQVFRFEPTGVGVGEIDFGYRQPWVTDQSPQRSFTVHVVVDNQGSH